ncbi:MAG: V-type ATP synthase subunit I [Candidatus Micrarchaeia archaeon]
MVLNPAVMVKLRMVCPVKHVDDLIEALYKFGAIQVEQSSMPELDKPRPRFESISDCLVRLRALEKGLNVDQEIASLDSSISVGELVKRSKSIDFDAFRSLNSKREQVREDLSALQSRRADLLPFRELKVSPKIFSKQSSLTFVYFALKAGSDSFEQVAKLKQALRHYNHELTLSKSDGKHYALLAFDKRYEEKVNVIVLKFASGVIAVPKTKSDSFAHEFARVGDEIKRLERELEGVGRSIELFKKENGEEIVKLRKSLEVASLKATLPSRFGRTKNLVVVEGWVMKKALARLEKTVKEVTRGSVVIERVKTLDTPPSVLKNPKVTKPFEFLIKFFSLPQFNEIDPTFFMAITFPLFFGMILGDIAYGLVALIISLLIKFRTKGEFLQSVGGIMFFSSLSTIFFGIIYGEFLGVEHIFGVIELHPLIHRMGHHGLNVLIALSLVLGALQLLLGLSLGAINSFNHGHTKHGFGKLSWIVFSLGALTLLAGYANAFPAGIDLVFLSNVAYVLSVAGFLGIAFFEGLPALLEVFSLMSNFFSYLRIMALGLSGAILAALIGSIPVDFSDISQMVVGGAPFDAGKVFLLLVMIVLFLIGHVLALVLGLFESSIQSLRLHYVEFFSKFYKGGGKAFVPLRKNSV